MRAIASDLDYDGQIEVDTSNNYANYEVQAIYNYYPFGMEMEGPWELTDNDSSFYKYNGKEITDDYFRWHDYGARWYDPVVGRFNRTDPISEKFSWVSTYNYAENDPVSSIDLWGLQKVASITLVGRDSEGKIFTIGTTTYTDEAFTFTEVQRFTNGEYDGEDGTLSVYHNVDDNQTIMIYTTAETKEKSSSGFLGWIKNLFNGDNEVNGGIMFTLSWGQGKEQRVSSNAKYGESLDDLFGMFDMGSAGGSIHGNALEFFEFVMNIFSNSSDVVDGVKDLRNKRRDKSEKPSDDTIFYDWDRTPTRYWKIDKSRNRFDTTNKLDAGPVDGKKKIKYHE